MPFGMRPALLVSLLLLSAALQASAAPWFASFFSNPLSDVQRLVQQQQQRRLQQKQEQQPSLLSAAAVQEPVAFTGRQLQTADDGSYGYGEYGYGYGGYGYGSYESTGGSSGSSSSSRRLQSVPAASSSGLAPTLVYGDEQQPSTRNLQQVLAAGLAHSDSIELAPEAIVPASLFEHPREKKAARRLLLTASNINAAALDQAVLPVAPLRLEPEDALLSGPGRALLTDDATGSYGYGYGYGYGGYGYGGYGEGSTGRSLLAVADADDAQLYALWLQHHNKQLAAKH